jgi:hypothetical protein
LLGKAVSVPLIACHEVSTRTLATALDARARPILRLPALHYRARRPAVLNLEFLDKLAVQPAAAHTRAASATFAALQTTRPCGSKVVKSDSHDLRVSTKSEDSPVSRRRTLPMTSSSHPNHSPNHSRRSRRNLQSHSPSRSL